MPAIYLIKQKQNLSPDKRWSGWCCNWSCDCRRHRFLLWMYFYFSIVWIKRGGLCSYSYFLNSILGSLSNKQTLIVQFLCIHVHLNLYIIFINWTIPKYYVYSTSTRQESVGLILRKRLFWGIYTVIHSEGIDGIIVIFNSISTCGCRATVISIENSNIITKCQLSLSRIVTIWCKRIRVVRSSNYGFFEIMPDCSYVNWISCLFLMVRFPLMDLKLIFAPLLFNFANWTLRAYEWLLISGFY